MLVSCKCLNFIAVIHSQQLPANSAREATSVFGIKSNNGTVAEAANSTQCNNYNESTSMSSSNINSIKNINSNKSDVLALSDALRKIFLQKYPRNFVFYSSCIEFFKQAIGPVTDLSVNSISQRDLIYSLTVELNETEAWQLIICSNCNMVLCAKQLTDSTSGVTSQQYLVNCALLTNHDEVSRKRCDKSFSETFGILIIDHDNNNNYNEQNAHNFPMGLLSTSLASAANLDSKLMRQRQLQCNLQQRLQQEITETDERIQRYAEQQFALLKSFREKSEQEYQMLMKLIHCIPEQQANEWLDPIPPLLELNGSNTLFSYGSSRRNTISSRRELNTAPSTPITPQQPMNIFPSNVEKGTQIAMTSLVSPSAADNNMDQASTVVSSTMSNRKVSNFDTPPDTPEGVSMSVGNSPTFRQQQQQQQQQHHTVQAMGQNTFQQQVATPTLEAADDCLFELEGIENATTNPDDSFLNTTISANILQNLSSPLRSNNRSNVAQQQHQSNVMQMTTYGFQRNLSITQRQQQRENRMSDLYESDSAEEGEDALELDVSSPMVMQTPPGRRMSSSNNGAQMMNFAKSLPIEIAHSPMASDRNCIATGADKDGKELDNNVDIAASIKALAKSVHGEAVFGELPRPLLRSQI
ncbi:uncharacterized protein LOC119636423 isoform X1 [Glossina fuscipes]|uniref:Uncharacterized protein LOC119636423 isoform X1 n=1 Tax=Glossina fuscipes TaxID=7396 RepID=A0A9C5Z0S1_9MUSC|nr:uncharacterized protein LOC119636423 isoform X1 [Glossina fuscipes]XP_037887675.1 uncharacterized protein LOC119636423 isoform X1 [Glossina fuscipes]XP_037887677.1 uncharacterized protein LOC119636423 isoform X1 [Glossina fuscipes]XP_037887678.1 uncharacterized protein LOC119636423 isoform X1 [Glossina fuscipes]XP_037887679.1 uncharacterized protein LOC119636423 isoform X1 [Glossina fuscipes]XP_037887680.1 uncharacterized protein LOC119636423 isoform X1 [Glossina fuscipes]XP_037887681.1 un